MLLGTRKNYNIANSLLKKGFKEKNTSHTHLILFIDGKKTSIFTFISHGKKEISDELMHKMAKQLKLSHEQFCELVDCSMNGETLREFYLDEGIVKL
jgi:predicted RNA binding protein YcfA (HicA-like mRNA interferase family)